MFACRGDMSQRCGLILILPMQTKHIPVILIWSIITTFLIIGFGKLAHNLVAQELKIQVQESLNSTLVTNITALKSWVHEKKYYAEELASRPDLSLKLKSVLTQAQNQALKANLNNKKLQDSKVSNSQEFNSEELQWLEKNLLPDGKNYGFTGFLIFDKKGNIITTNSVTPIDNQSFPEKYLRKSLSGKTFLTKPFLSKIPLKDRNGIYQENQPTMLVSTPIMEADGNIIGSLALLIRPETEFSQIINISKAGITGETYAVDQDGKLLSETHHFADKEEQKASRTTGTINLQLKNTELVQPEEKDKAIFKNINPLTQMAASMVRSESGVDVSGYPDYRGVSVVGAWAWVKELELGLATEMKFSEAFKAIQLLKSVLGAIFGLLVMISGIGIIFYIRNKNLQDNLVAVRDKAELDNQFKTNFLSRMSHDFLTPMNAIIGFCQLLESDPDEPLSESQEMAMEQISKASDNLMDLINEILDITRIESGTMNLNMKPCKMRSQLY